LSGKLGKQSLRFRAAKTFFFGITFFLYQNGNPADDIICWKQFDVSLNDSTHVPTHRNYFFVEFFFQTQALIRNWTHREENKT
jgi:hypothetical protein